MVALFSTPVLLIGGDGDSTWQITDQQGTPLATAVQVGGHRRGRLERAFSVGETDRKVVAVNGLDGATLFYVDRAGQQHASMRLSPVAVVNANGTLAGRVTFDSRHWAQQLLAGGMMPNGASRVFPLLDAAEATVGRIVSEPISAGIRHNYQSDGPNDSRLWMSGGNTYFYTDLNGVQIAQHTIGRQTTLQLFAQLPYPLRTLAVAGPLAVELMLAAGEQAR